MMNDKVSFLGATIYIVAPFLSMKRNSVEKLIIFDGKS